MAYKQKLATFDASEVVMSWGATKIDGLADGTFVEVVQENDSFTDVSGADGEVMRSKTNDRRFEITFTLMQSSDANGPLSEAHNVDIRTPNGDGIQPLRIYDKASGTVIFAEKAWLKRHADTGFAKEHTDRVWALRSNNVDVKMAGNPAV